MCFRDPFGGNIRSVNVVKTSYLLVSRAFWKLALEDKASSKQPL